MTHCGWEKYFVAILKIVMTPVHGSERHTQKTTPKKKKKGGWGLFFFYFAIWNAIYSQLGSPSPIHDT